MFILCKHCQTKIKQKRSDQKWCSTECKMEHYKQEKRDKNKQRHLAKPKKCKHCSKEYVQHRDDQLFCSKKCKMSFHKAGWKKETAKKRASTTKKCKLCEKEFTPERTMRQVYCSKRCRELIPKRAYQMLRRCMKLTKQSKLHHTHEVLGYTPAQLQEHIMSHPNWEKVKDGPWHLDHVFPIVAFLEHGITDMSVICALKNLQPLSDGDNHSKNGNYDKVQFKHCLEKEITHGKT